MTQGGKVEETKSVPHSVLNIAVTQGLMGITRKALGHFRSIIISKQKVVRKV